MSTDQTRPTDDQSGPRAHVQVREAAELDALPLGHIVVDRDGDRWMHDSRGAWISPETSFVSSATLLRKYGPVRDLIADAVERGARSALLSAADVLDRDLSAGPSPESSGYVTAGRDLTRWLRARAEQTGGDHASSLLVATATSGDGSASELLEPALEVGPEAEGGERSEEAEDHQGGERHTRKTKDVETLGSGASSPVARLRPTTGTPRALGDDEPDDGDDVGGDGQDVEGDVGHADHWCRDTPTTAVAP